MSVSGVSSGGGGVFDQGGVAGTSGQSALSAEQAPTTVGDDVMAYGDQGTDVANVQELLIGMGADLGGEADAGYYGPVTEQVVRHHQENNGLPASGEVNAQTLEMLTLTAEQLLTETATPDAAAAVEQAGGQGAQLAEAASQSVDDLRDLEELRAAIKQALTGVYGGESAIAAGARGVAGTLQSRGEGSGAPTGTSTAPAPASSTGGAGAPAPGSASQPAPASSSTGAQPSLAAPSTAQIPSYQDTFGRARWVQDTNNAQLQQFAKAAVAASPELQNSQLATNLAAGTMTRDDVRALQSHLQSKGFDVGSTGADGKYGPRTHAALQRLVNGEVPARGAAGTTTPATTTPTGTTPAGARPTGTTTPGVTAPGQATFQGDGIPPEMQAAYRTAMASSWNRSGKCLQFAGTMAAASGGVKTSSAPASQAHRAFGPPIKDFRGRGIDELGEAVDQGILKPGMLVHVKAHAERDPAYHTGDDAHHWFAYMGKDAQGVPRFADRKGNMQTAERMHARMRGWRNSRIYGMPRVTAFYDPHAGKR